MRVDDLLTALLLESANDAAADLAVGVAGSVGAFVAEMNAEARRMGLRDTHYANPVGLDAPGHHTSAADLATLTRVLLGDPTFAGIVDRPRARLKTGERPRVVVNRNDLVGRVPWIDGVKTGTTIDAGHVLVASGRRRHRRLISVVLGSPSEAARDAGTLSLLRWGFGRYEPRIPVRAGADVATVGVEGQDRPLALRAERGAVIVARKGQRVELDIVDPGRVEGPIAAGQPVGVARILVDGHARDTVPLVAAREVPGPGLLDGWRLPATVVVVALGAAALVALRRRRLAVLRRRRNRNR
jgi:D-alanyl-D-alanine carboxypeptidase (penicillin-binding protein 5/6)